MKLSTFSTCGTPEREKKGDRTFGLVKNKSRGHLIYMHMLDIGKKYIKDA